MPEFSKQHCEACRVGAPLLTLDEKQQVKQELPKWNIIEIDNVEQLQRNFKFNTFVDALAFGVKVGMLAEKQDHHPAIKIEWGSVQINWWSHKIKGLHKNDAICAAKTDEFYCSTAN